MLNFNSVSFCTAYIMLILGLRLGLRLNFISGPVT